MSVHDVHGVFVHVCTAWVKGEKEEEMRERERSKKKKQVSCQAFLKMIHVQKLERRRY